MAISATEKVLRALAQRCCYASCDAMADDDCLMCPRHRKRVNEIKRLSAQRKRALMRQAENAIKKTTNG